MYLMYFNPLNFLSFVMVKFFVSYKSSQGETIILLLIASERILEVWYNTIQAYPVHISVVLFVCACVLYVCACCNMCAQVSMPTPQHACGGQRATFKSHFSFPVQVPVIEARVSSLRF